MGSPFTLTTFGVEALSARFKAETREFKREQRVKMRVAANMVKAEVVQEVQNRFASRGAHKGPSGKKLGPLDRSIGVRVLPTTANVIAFIRPRARAFYGRFLETGLNVMRKGRVTKATAGGRKRDMRRHGEHAFKLPRIPFLEPVARSVPDRVAAIIGESYDVFYRGGA